MIANLSSRALRAGFAAFLLAFAASDARAAATITIFNNDGAGEGFNDPTPVAPVGGNTGTTLGQQRLNAFAYAAQIWGATLSSEIEIKILANFDPLTCTATSAVLGSAGPRTIWRNFPNAPFTDVWYNAALANKLAAEDLLTETDDPDFHQDIRARFNSNLGNTGCLTGSPFYYGLDNNHGTRVNLVSVLLHEFAHGLGVISIVDEDTGELLEDEGVASPGAYDLFLYDNTLGRTWPEMTNAERAFSAINTRRLAWNGVNVTTEVPNVLSLGTPELRVTAPSGIAGTYLVGAAAFGPQLSSPGITGEVMPVPTPATGAGCTPFSPLDRAAVNGKIAMIDRGVCGFVVKVKNAQDAGAIGVIIGDNAAGSPPAGLGGADPTITIPSVRITLADANRLRTVLRFRSRTRSGVFATLGVNALVYAGADPSGRALMYNPNPTQPGSSISHFDTSAFPNLLMEPAINTDLTHLVGPPKDLTFPLLRDLGW